MIFVLTVFISELAGKPLLARIWAENEYYYCQFHSKQNRQNGPKRAQIDSLTVLTVILKRPLYRLTDITDSIHKWLCAKGLLVQKKPISEFVSVERRAGLKNTLRHELTPDSIHYCPFVGVTRGPKKDSLLDPLGGTASAQQQFSIPSSEGLEHAQLGPKMIAGLTEAEGRLGSRIGRMMTAGSSPHLRHRGVPESCSAKRNWVSPNTAHRHETT